MARGGCRLSTLIVSKQAAKDIRSAARYIFKETKNADTADALAASIWKTCGRIAERPMIGRTEPEYGLRSFPTEDHRIFYRVRGNVVRIVRVLHQRRDFEKPLRRYRRK